MNWNEFGELKIWEESEDDLYPEADDLWEDIIPELQDTGSVTITQGGRQFIVTLSVEEVQQ